MNMNGRVRGKIAVVTGAAIGIGRACAKFLAAEGAAVAVTDIHDELGQELVDEICLAGGTAGYWHLDVSSEQQVVEVMRMVRSKFGPVSVLVNNATILGASKPTHELSSEEWDRLMAVNVKGVFFCTKHILPQMTSNKKGSIINLSFAFGCTGESDFSSYHVSTGALHCMTKTDAVTYASKGIRVNSICPGFIATSMVEKYVVRKGGDAEQAKAKLACHLPLGRLGEPEDVAYAVLYLASDESKFVTGTELVIDGGFSAR